MGREQDRRWPPEQQALIDAAYADLLKSAVYSQSEVDRALIDKAFRVANAAHFGVVRKSGEPYILHPLAVAKLVTRVLPGDAESIACALLHDVVEDTEITVDDIKREFNSNIAVIVNGLTKIDKFVESSGTKQTVNYQKLINTIEEDFRTIFIKLADRLHNMQTLGSMREEKQKRIASETTYFYAPIAERLGLYDFKTQLEDLAFRYRSPQEYAEIEQKLKLSEEQFINRINSFARPISAKLTQSGMEYSITSRAKSIYSIWRKMQRKHITFEEVYDLLAMRIVFTPRAGIPEKTQCWFIYMIITDIYHVLRDRTRDWVSTPKVNGYEALQCTLLSRSGNWIEVQIRSERMNAIAENGLAAHWKYKGEKFTDSYAKLFESLRAQVTQVQSVPYQNATDFVTNIQTALLLEQIVVYDSQGKEYRISRQATALDFAYLQSVNIGNTAIGARIDGVLRALDTRLRGGEHVEILTVPSQTPSEKWGDFVRTPLAKNYIEEELAARKRSEIASGRQRVAEMCKHMRIACDESRIIELLDLFKRERKNQESSKNNNLQGNKAQQLEKRLENFYVDVSKGNINMRILRRRLRRNRKKIVFLKGLPFTCRPERPTRRATDVAGEVAGTQYEVVQASCCSALPGDEVTSFKRDERTVVAHRTICPEAIRLMAQQGDKMVHVEWQPSKEQRYTAQFYLEGRDGKGLLESIFKSISEGIDVNVHKVDMQSDGFSFSGVISVHVRDVKELEAVMQAANRVVGVLKVSRVLGMKL